MHSNKDFNGDCCIHIEKNSQLHDVKMTRYGLVYKGLASAD